MTIRSFFAVAATVLYLCSELVHASPAATIKSATKLTFGDTGTLFVADWKGARIYTLPVPVPKAAAAKPFNLKDIQGPIATALGVPQSSIRFEDLAVQPGSEIAYVSLTVRRGKSPAQAAIVSIDASGKVKTVDLRKVAGSAAITDEPSADQSFWRDLRRRA
ncbi:hypothetical protein ACFQAT_26650 [Undibacterium arcticum]|uniref:Uncharacterized protein n=1 Tax=Undibacterium arcticum TaxID=1762892 RepID=A0ABV7EYH8_9BURK